MISALLMASGPLVALVVVGLLIGRRFERYPDFRAFQRERDSQCN